MKNKELFLALLSIPGFGNMSRNRIIDICGDIESVFTLSDSEILKRASSFDKKRPIAKERMTAFLEFRKASAWKDSVNALVKECKEKGITIITRDDPDYPNRLKGLDAAPVVLFAKGKLKINQFGKATGIIGAKDFTSDEEKEAVNLSKKESKSESAIISGLSKGIDAVTNTTALSSKGYMIAVSGAGADKLPSPDLESLYESIAQNGCILSEDLPGTPIRRYSLIHRNRLIAALSDELFIIDAQRSSLTASTVEACVRLGKNFTMV